MPHPHIARTFAVVLGIASMTANAGSVSITGLEFDEGNALALLEASSQYYVDAMRRLITENYKDEYRAIRWEGLDAAMSAKPVARFEYRYRVGYEDRVRVYHALGGEPLGTTARTVFDGPSRPSTPGTPTSPLTPEIEDHENTVVQPSDYVADDAADGVFYEGFDDTNVRAVSLRPEGSALESFVVEDTDRTLDAEFKALRTLERDIVAHGVPAGGKLVGFVSQSTCSSCRYAMTDFARQYDVDITLTQLRESIPRPQQVRLIAEGKAKLRGLQLVGVDDGRPLLVRDLLVESREAQVRQSLSPRAMGRAFKGAQWRQRSFRLGPARLPRVSEGTALDDLPPNMDAAEPPPPSC